MNKNKINYLKICFLFCLFLFGWTAHASINIPLTIQEALPAGVSGITRANEPVTVGIPLAEDANVTNVNQLGLSNVSSGQFRPLAWWPNGNMKWVLADFQTDVDAGAVSTNISLINGSGNFGGQDLAVDNGSTISVNTGNAQFAIKKSNFNVFDSVVVDGQQLISTGNNGRVEMVDVNDIIYSSINDNSATAVIEENGPVKSVIKSIGSLKDNSGQRLIDYTLRLYFVKNKSYVKGAIFLRNASRTAPSVVDFKSAQIVVPLNLLNQKTVTFSRSGDVVSAELQNAGVSYMYQGYNNAAPTVTNALECYTWNPPVRGNCAANVFSPNLSYSGLEIKNGTNTLHSLGASSDKTQGFASFNDSSGKGLNVAMKYMSAYYPSGFEFGDNGEASVEFYSKHNGDIPLKFMWSGTYQTGSWGYHERREVMWDFHVTSSSELSTLYRLQYPLLARASFNHYMQTKAMYGQSELATVSEQDSIFGEYDRTPPSLDNPALATIFRSWQWVLGSGVNQTDLPLDDLLDFYRTGNAGFYLNGEQRTKYNADSATPRGDDFTKERIIQTGDVSTAGRVNSGFVDNDHAHFLSTPFYYFISGDEAIRESFIDYGEALMCQQDLKSYAIPGNKGGTTGDNADLRSIARRLRNFSIAYEFTCQLGSCNNEYKNIISGAMDTYLSLRDTPVTSPDLPQGFNLERGFWYWDYKLTTMAGFGLDGGVPHRLNHSLYSVPIWFEAVYQTYRVMNDTNWDYPRKIEMEDFMTGMSKFIIDEWLTYYPGGQPGAGADFKYKHIYDYYLDADTPSSHVGNLYYSMGRPSVWAYQHSGDREYLVKGGWLLWESTEGGFPRNPSELQDQAFMYTYANYDAVPVWRDIAVAVVNNGSGSYTLSWTVPAGAQKYQIKYSGKPIVDWLGFDKITRTYQYEPSQYTAFFAATNIVNNPTPAGAGTTQSITLSGLPENQNFSIKALVSGPDLTPPITTPSSTGGTFSSPQTVALSANESAIIYYTADGSTPTESSTQYSAPIQISHTTTLKFFAKDSAGNKEEVKTQIYTIKKFNLIDFIQLKTDWLKTMTSNADLDLSGKVNSKDLGIMMSGWE